MLTASDGAGSTATQPDHSGLGSGGAFFAGLAQQFGISQRTLFVVGGLIGAVLLSGTVVAPLIYGVLVAAIIYQAEAWIK